MSELAKVLDDIYKAIDRGVNAWAEQGDAVKVVPEERERETILSQQELIIATCQHLESE